jgi:hypothetical protein
MDIALTVLAILLSPLIALWIGGILQERQRRFLQRVWILQTLQSSRHSLSDERIRAFNSIDLIFRKDDKIRGLWHELFEMYKNADYSKGDGPQKRIDKESELIDGIAVALGYGDRFSRDDAARVYIPVGFAEPVLHATQLMKELNRIISAIPTPVAPPAPEQLQQAPPASAEPGKGN